MVELKQYQINNAILAADIIRKYHIAYLGMEMRTGKTFTSLTAMWNLNKKKVLFITSKKAKPSIIADYKKLNPEYDLSVVVNNHLNIAKLRPEYDGIIVDEAHNFGAFPIPSERTKNLKKIIQNNDLILLSGTPSPETSGTQLFHQFWLSAHNPFNIESFYKWAALYVKIKTKFVNGITIKDYSEGKYDEIMKVVKPMLITYTQKEAGIKCEINETIHQVDIEPNIYKLIEILKAKKIYKFKSIVGKKDDYIICDSAAKEKNKIHQLCSGTIITENKEYRVLDYSKANYIKQHFSNKKIAIFYNFIAEGIALRSTFTNWTDNYEEFNKSTDKIFICQVVSGREGIDLSSADALVYYNINFASVTYWQSRARLSNLKRSKPCDIHWIFSRYGIEHNIYEAVLNKKDYTLNLFKRDYVKIGKLYSSNNNQIFKNSA